MKAMPVRLAVFAGAALVAAADEGPPAGGVGRFGKNLGRKALRAAAGAAKSPAGTKPAPKK